jgi:phospholipid/cholesterol/gamma-HCH transport system substrate-binding protein
VHNDKLYDLLNTTANDFSVVASDLKTVTDKVAKGEGTIGKLLHEDELYNSLTASAKSLENSSAKVDRLVDNTNTLVTDSRSTVDTVSEAAAAAKSVLTKVDHGEGTLGKLVNQDVLYAETTEAMKNLREIVQKINRGEGTVGMLVNDDSLFKSARATLQKVDNATETMEDQGPVSVIGLMFNGLF